MTADNKYYWEPSNDCLSCGNDEGDHCSNCEVCTIDLVEVGSIFLCLICKAEEDE